MFNSERTGRSDQLVHTIHMLFFLCNTNGSSLRGITDFYYSGCVWSKYIIYLKVFKGLPSIV